MSINLNIYYEKIKNSKAGYRLAVAAPYDGVIIRMIEEAYKEGIIKLWLVGEEEKIKTALSLSGLKEEDVNMIPSRTEDAADIACKLINDGKCDILMKGSIHTDELLRGIIRNKLMMPGRRISHIYAIHKPDGSALFISDPSIAIKPSLEEKIHITDNTIDFLKKLGIEKPRIAVVSSVENVNPKMESTVDAKNLTECFKSRNDCFVYGPLGLDNAVSQAAASLKKIENDVAGNADALIMPDLDSGNLLCKGLIYIAGLPAAGVLYGTSCPVVFTSRSASEDERMRTLYLACLNYELSKNNA